MLASLINVGQALQCCPGHAVLPRLLDQWLVTAEGYNCNL